MMRFFFIFMLAASSVRAETIVAARTIPARTVITEDDLAISGEATGEALRQVQLIIGMEARVALFAGRPIRTGDLSQPAVVERNQIIPLFFKKNGLVISTDGRALGRAGPGDTIRVMNIGSRTTVSATIGNDGVAHVLR